MTGYGLKETELPKPSPNGDSLPYWNAAREKRLLIRLCKACGAKHFLPRYLCPVCWSDQLDWIESKGQGTIHSSSIVHRASLPSFASQTPYVIALIDLNEGPRMFANIIGSDSLAASIGDRVRVVFEDRAGDMLPQFSRVVGDT